VIQKTIKNRIIENEVIYDSFYDFSSDGNSRARSGERLRVCRTNQAQQITGDLYKEY